MFIRSITLCGYKRLLSSDIRYLKIEFKDIQQLLLGANGSGKSSTLQELNPMPATPQDYLKGGYKVIDIEHRGNNYRLSSFIDTGARHSFIINGLELNDGGTALVQKTLVFEHFGLDQDLIEVLTDQTRFHLFSPLERRNWLTRLSGTNMDFALGFFKYVKDQLRDTDAIIKYTNARIIKESGDIMTEEHLEGLKEEAQNLSELILEMMGKRNHESGNPDIALDELRKLSDEALEITRVITHTRFYNPYTSIQTLSELRDFITIKQQERNTKETIKNNLYAEFSELKDALAVHSTIENEDINELTRRLQEINGQIQTLKNEIRVYKDVNEASELYGATLAIKNSLLNRINELTNNSDGKFNKQDIANNNQQLTMLSDGIGRLDFKVRDLKIAIDRMKMVEEVDCPSCHTTFKPGVDPNLVLSLENQIKEAEAVIETKAAEKLEIENYLAEARSYAIEYQALTNLMNESVNLKPVWDNIRAVNLTQTHPSELIKVFYTWENDISKHVAINKLILEAATVEATIDKINAVQNNEISLSKQRLSSLSEAITKIISDIDNLSREINEAVELEKTHNSIFEGYNKLSELLTKRNDYKSKYLVDYGQQVLQTWINELNINLAKITEQINAGQQIFDTIAQLELDRDRHIAKREILKTIIKELNPTDGLIAKQSKLFIEQFVDQINKVINAIWTYEMKVLPCPIESDKLTYKFPIYFSSTEASTSDIAKSSAAQKGIVDFAFKLVVMAYLGLTDYPLYLDELAPSLDEKHRSNIMDFVKNFVESKQCSQMFMISHYHTGHGVFSNAEVTILDDTNLLTKPDSFNKNLIISNKMRAYREEQ